jgi:hypothetical protein
MKYFLRARRLKRGTNFPNYFIFGRYTECFALNFGPSKDQLFTKKMISGV